MVRSEANTQPVFSPATAFVSASMYTQVESWLRPKIETHFPDAIPPIDSKSLPGPRLMFMVESVTQASKLTGWAVRVGKALVVAVRVGTKERV